MDFFLVQMKNGQTQPENLPKCSVRTYTNFFLYQMAQIKLMHAVKNIETLRESINPPGRAMVEVLKKIKNIYIVFI